jgi:quinol monooxygenase YgiN
MDSGLLRLAALQQSGRPDHFAILALWQDQDAFEAHAGAAHTCQCHDALQPLRVSPHDQRLHTALVTGSPPTTRLPGATYVLTHADAIPPAKDEALVLLMQLAEASRHEDGAMSFEVLQQRNRQNHFTLVELWRDRQALEAHAMAAHTRRFREQFQPMSGSLYDERLYEALA